MKDLYAGKQKSLLNDLKKKKKPKLMEGQKMFMYRKTQ